MKRKKIKDCSICKHIPSKVHNVGKWSACKMEENLPRKVKKLKTILHFSKSFVGGTSSSEKIDCYLEQCPECKRYYYLEIDPKGEYIGRDFREKRLKRITKKQAKNLINKCPICSKLKDHMCIDTWTGGTMSGPSKPPFSFPKEAEKLKGLTKFYSYSKGDINQCPKCGIYYRWKYEDDNEVGDTSHLEWLDRIYTQDAIDALDDRKKRLEKFIKEVKERHKKEIKKLTEEEKVFLEYLLNNPATFKYSTLTIPEKFETYDLILRKKYKFSKTKIKKIVKKLLELGILEKGYYARTFNFTVSNYGLYS